MKTVMSAIVVTMLMAAAPAGFAEQQPDELIRTTVSEVLAAYEAGKDQHGTDPDFLREIIEQRVLPYVDFRLMSKLVLGKHWRKATEQQRADFSEQFKELLIRTYQKPLAEYSGQQINFLPFHEGGDPKKATVDSEIVPHKGIPIPVSYKLRYKEDIGWKVYDIYIDSVSMVGNYRSAFSGEISRSGLDDLIASMTQKSADGGVE